jgi:hypothetical protein
LPVGVLVVLLSGVAIYRHHVVHREHARALIDQQAALALEFDLAIRDYVGREIRPRMAQCLGPEEFVPETMSTSFVARRVFEGVMRTFPEYILKFSTDHPRNPANRATPDEQRMIDYFRANPQVDRWSGLIELGGEQYSAHFRARRMGNECGQCHGRPEDAPAALV